MSLIAQIMYFRIIATLNYINVMRSKIQPMDHSVQSYSVNKITIIQKLKVAVKHLILNLKCKCS